MLADDTGHGTIQGTDDGGQGFDARAAGLAALDPGRIRPVGDETSSKENFGEHEVNLLDGSC